MLTDKKVVVTGGTGSLGNVLVRRLLSGEMGKPRAIVVFSRDEAKQHAMRLAYQRRKAATDEVIYRNSVQMLQFQIGDVRDYHSVSAVLHKADVVLNAAALKQVPSCEYFPFEAVQTNIIGPQNIVQTIRENKLPVDTVVGISTDKACEPVSVMGMTKAIHDHVICSYPSGTDFYHVEEMIDSDNFALGNRCVALIPVLIFEFYFRPVIFIEKDQRNGYDDFFF